MITETKWGRFDGSALLTSEGAIIRVDYVFTDDAQIDNDELLQLKKYLLGHSDELGGIASVTFKPNGKDALISVAYTSGAVKGGSTQELFFKAVLDCYTRNKAAFDSKVVRRIVAMSFGGAGNVEVAIEPYVAALLKL